MKNKNKTIYRQSKQRVKILELLRSTDKHPTADWLYARLKKEFPNLSLGTVYRNLNVLVEQGKVKKLQFGSTYDRFEANVGQHCHLVCEQCGEIDDLVMPIDIDLVLKANQLTDFTINRQKIEFFGICPECAKEKKKDR